MTKIFLSRSFSPLVYTFWFKTGDEKKKYNTGWKKCNFSLPRFCILQQKTKVSISCISKYAVTKRL